MKDQFQRVLDIYLSDGTGLVDKNRESYQVIRYQIPEIIRNILSDNQFEVTGSDGQGKRTSCPWISILNTNVTDSTQKGLYLIYLFKKDMSGFYLSLNQGYTYLSKKYLGNDKKERIKTISNYFKGLVSNTSLSKEEIHLVKSEYKTPNIVSKYYPSGSSFTEEDLINDLRTFVAEYKAMIAKLNGKTYEEVIKEQAGGKLNVNKGLFDYIKENDAEDEKINPIDFEAISAWLRDHGGKSHKEGDEKGTKPWNEFKDFFEKIVNNKALSNYDSVQWQHSGHIFDYFWTWTTDPKYTTVKGGLSLSLRARYDATKQGLCVAIRLESKDTEIKDLSLDEKKEINRKLLQRINLEGVIYQDVNGKEYTYDRALAEIEKDENYLSKQIFKIRPNYFLKAPFKKSETKRLVKEGREKIKEFINAYYKMVKGDESNMAEKLGKNIILYGPPGTGKTYNSRIYAVAICDGKTIDNVKAMDYESQVIPRYDELVEEGRVAFTTFHQSYSYEEFIEGIQPLLDDKSGEKKVYYDVMPGVFKKFCEESTTDNAEVVAKPCVFIIDEINRGNISKIFGELITLIEESKRQGSVEAMSCTLPYSRKSFSVPNNVYILGTMNTADRSIAIMDTALRRRFDFVEMLPEKNALDGVNVEGLDIPIPTLLDIINKRIELLYDREHTIGHAYFMQLKKEPTLATLKHIFKDRVLPLLQEYFYEDYNKIRLVFGCNAFIEEETIVASTYFKNAVPEGMLQEKKYTINESAFDDITNYNKIK